MRPIKKFCRFPRRCARQRVPAGAIADPDQSQLDRLEASLVQLRIELAILKIAQQDEIKEEFEALGRKVLLAVVIGPILLCWGIWYLNANDTSCVVDISSLRSFLSTGDTDPGFDDPEGDSEADSELISDYEEGLLTRLKVDGGSVQL
jgi:hypothetical protein